METSHNTLSVEQYAALTAISHVKLYKHSETSAHEHTMCLTVCKGFCTNASIRSSVTVKQKTNMSTGSEVGEDSDHWPIIHAASDKKDGGYGCCHHAGGCSRGLY